MGVVGSSNDVMINRLGLRLCDNWTIKGRLFDQSNDVPPH